MLPAPTNHQKAGIHILGGALRNSTEQRLDPFAGVEEAEVSDQDCIGRNVEPGSPRGPIIARRDLYMDIGTNGN